MNDEEMSLFNWHLANLEFANAGLLSNISLAFWDQDDSYDKGGDHCLPGGNGRLVQALAENVSIMFEKTVHVIRYGIYEPQGIEVPLPILTVCTRWGSDPFSFGSYSNVAVGASGDDYEILAETVGEGRLFFAGEATTSCYAWSIYHWA
ncbi:hypothetical protein K7X08_017158 [Anisodus acutangulus]|uniref:Amine oxidase domain-containing protein n=1 Tax=Anisodus acutangulus TaxID=402998 RepID=A0A9Q1LU47_9SOLA|nr:hypothetical protein K7X08_017158 [Anisodus acutangulus]